MKSITIQSFRDFQPIAQALSIDVRVQIMELLQQGSFNVNEIAAQVGIPVSTATVNIKKLEEVGLLRSEMQPGKRGSQKICSLNLKSLKLEPRNNIDEVSMPIGQFVKCAVEPTCGLVSESAKIGEYDDVGSFYLPERIEAQLIWVGNGYLEYNFPNRIDPERRLLAIEVSMEICSEAPFFKNKWPSDITLWLNGHACGCWTAPGDFGGKRGKFTPKWWGVHKTQFGQLVCWRIALEGTSINGSTAATQRVDELGLNEQPFIRLRVGTADDAENRRGFNLFGSRFGNYNQDIRLKLVYD